MTDTTESELDVRRSDSLEEKDDIAPEDIRDIGADLYAEVEQLSPEELEKEGIRVRKMLDRRILPIVRPCGIHCLANCIVLCISH
jgi:hypothetical protein